MRFLASAATLLLLAAFAVAADLSPAVAALMDRTREMDRIVSLERASPHRLPQMEQSYSGFFRV